MRPRCKKQEPDKKNKKYELEEGADEVLMLRYVLTYLQFPNLQTPRVYLILMPYLRTSFWHAHGEVILPRMLCSTNQDEINFTVDNRSLAGQSQI